MGRGCASSRFIVVLYSTIEKKVRNGVLHLVHCKCSLRNDASASSTYITTVYSSPGGNLNMDVSWCTLDGSPMGENGVVAPQRPKHGLVMRVRHLQ
jgi:hypothetical protein